MGIDCSLYLGPYVECDVEMVDVPENCRTCMDATCVRHGGEVNSKRCPECGGPVGDVPIPTPRPNVDVGELKRSIDDSLAWVTPPEFGDKLDIWVPNLLTPEGERRPHYDCPGDDALVEITPETIVAEILAFRRAYAKEIAALDTAYGGRMRIKWGMVLSCG